MGFIPNPHCEVVEGHALVFHRSNVGHVFMLNKPMSYLPSNLIVIAPDDIDMLTYDFVKPSIQEGSITSQRHITQEIQVVVFTYTGV